jgi:hypothetical protein
VGYSVEVSGADLPVLKYLDEFGDTCFNALQVRAILPELATLQATAGEDAAAFDELTELARRVLEQPHRFLIFVGE